MDKQISDLVNVILSVAFGIGAILAVLENNYNLAFFIGLFTLISLYINIMSLFNSKKEVKRKNIGFEMSYMKSKRVKTVSKKKKFFDILRV